MARVGNQRIGDGYRWHTLDHGAFGSDYARRSRSESFKEDALKLGLLQRLSANSLNALESVPATNALNYAAQVLWSASPAFPWEGNPTATSAPAAAAASRNPAYAVGASGASPCAIGIGVAKLEQAITTEESRSTDKSISTLSVVGAK